ncbi:MAG: hypothetical protein SH808_00700 [Saprospiraceae bacterium]|nr:hypothetical protein [Saprospiraceae bacterium]
MYKLTFFTLFLVVTIASCKTDDAKPESSPSATFDQVSETDAIMSVIENETSCFYARDYNCWKAHYAHVDYAFQSWNNADGTFDAKVGWGEINSKAGKFIQDNPVPPGGSSHPKVERRNVKVKFFNSGLAYLSWNQYNINPAMKMYTPSLETRIMEKIGGAWKIVNVTAYWDYVNLVPVNELK